MPTVQHAFPSGKCRHDKFEGDRVTTTGFSVWQRGVLTLILMAALLVGCNPSAEQTITSSAAKDKGVYDVAPVFREFYDSLGGESLLGPAISTLFQQEDAECQYTLNVLMCQRPAESGIDRFYLSGLGSMMNMRDIPDSFPESANQSVVDGFIIFPDFFPIYTSLYGSRFAGKALTQVRYDYDRRRVEQYFENVAVAHDFDAPPQAAHLLPLGQYFCGDQCSESLITLPASTDFENVDLKDMSHSPVLEVATPFAAAIQQMDGFEVFGRPITHPFYSPDGLLLHIFEKVVVCSPADTPEQANLCPMAAVIGIESSAAAAKLYDIQEGMMFYIVEGELGFHVPLAFDSFIQQHGGRRASGDPIGEVTLYQDGTVRQCFEHYCLDFVADSSAKEKVDLASLGGQYLQSGLQQGWITPEVVLPGAPSQRMLLMVAEEKPQVTSADTQTIYVSVMTADTKAAVAGAYCQLTVTLPDSRQFLMNIPPTDSEGRSAVDIPLMPELQSGSMVSYTACLAGSAEEVCASDAYLVWNSHNVDS